MLTQMTKVVVGRDFVSYARRRLRLGCGGKGSDLVSNLRR